MLELGGNLGLVQLSRVQLILVACLLVFELIKFLSVVIFQRYVCEAILPHFGTFESSFLYPLLALGRISS